MARKRAKTDSDEKTPASADASNGTKVVLSNADRLGFCKPLCSSFPIPAFILDTSGRVIAASEIAADFFGRPLSDIVGAVFSDFFIYDEALSTCTRSTFVEAMEKRRVTDCIVGLRKGDGTPLIIKASMGPYDDEGNHILFVALFDMTAERSAEAERHEVEERYRMLFENLNRGIAIYEAIDDGKNFVIKEFNRSSEDMEHVKREEVVGKLVTDAFPGVKTLGLLDVFQRVWKTGTQEHLPPAVYEDARLGRSWRKNDVFKLPTGQIVSVYVDVTDRMETLRKLEESEIRYRALFENMRSGVAVYETVDDGRDFIIKEFNQAAARNDKVKRTDVVGKPVTEVFPGADKIGFVDVLRRVWKEGKPEYFPPTLYEDVRIGTVWWEDYVYKLPTGELVATFENVTERMKAVDDLRRSVSQVMAERDKIDTIVQSIAEAVFVVDKDDAIILFNEAASVITGIPMGEAIGKRYVDHLKFVAGPDEKRADAFIKAARETGMAATASGDVVLINREGRRIAVATSAAPLKSADGVTGVVVVFRDVSAEREADKMKTEYASITSRQMHTPLTDVRWYLELLLRGKAGQIPPKAREYVEQINATNERMIRLVEELLSISKSEAVGSGTLPNDAIDISTIIRDVINENIDLMRDNRVSVEISESIPKKFYLRVDQKSIRDVFRHLISNAVKYSKGSGKVDVSFDGSRKDALLFSVKDYGYGIPARQQSRVFTRFFRADNILTKYPEGTGLGLSACKATVEAMGGRIWFTSIENVGSTFYFTLPKAVLPGKRQRTTTERSAAYSKTARQEGWLDAE